MEERTIKIRIGEVEYELKSKSPEQEELIREAAKMLNEMITSYQRKYPNKDKVDILSIASINQCMVNIKLQREMENVRREIAEFNEEIDGYLRNTEN